MSLLLLLNPTVWGAPAPPAPAGGLLAANAPTLDDLEIILHHPGGHPIRLLPVAESMRWSTVAVGGFGSFACKVHGPPPRNVYLATVTASLGPRVIYQGVIEDVDFMPVDEVTELQAFGWARELDRNDAQGVWSKVDFEWREARLAETMGDGNGTTMTNRNAFQAQAGAIDDTDLARRGVRFTGTGISLSIGDAKWLQFALPQGCSILTFSGYFEHDMPDTQIEGFIAPGVIPDGSDTPGNVIGVRQLTTTGQTFTVTCPPLANFMRLAIGCYATPSSPSQERWLVFRDLRAVGMHAEDETGAGNYGGTLLRDLIRFAPTLQAGEIDVGDEFVIGQFEALQPVAIRQLIEQVTGLYSRELAVWEDGRVDWRAPTLQEPDWVVPLSQLEPGTRFTGTVDGVPRKTILVYQDAARDNDQANAQAESTSVRNPFVRVDRPSTEVLQAGFPMTPVSAAALVEKISADRGEAPTVVGRATLAADTLIRARTGELMPAWAIRAGENLLIPDMPKTEPFTAGPDRETLFHIVSCDVNVDEQQVTLELEGQTRRLDVTLARLAAATRLVTG